MSILGKSNGKAISRVHFDIIVKRFLIFLKRELRITYDIPVILIDDAEFAKTQAAFGVIAPDNIIRVSIINRHPMDILRTLAHEYVHYKQSLDSPLPKSNFAGSSIENQANAKAGEILRKYGKLHPELFEFMSVK